MASRAEAPLPVPSERGRRTRGNIARCSKTRSLFALLQYADGIAVIHAFWAIAYLTGSIVRTPRMAADSSAGEPRRCDALIELIVSSVAGMAIIGFFTFIAGLLGAIYPIVAAVFAIALIAAFVALGDSPLRRRFWTVRWVIVSASASPASIGLYVLTLVFAIPSILPETQYDALFYHLPYALDWSTAHRIFVDPFRRFPYYANNWLLLDAWMYELGLGAFVSFLGWLAGALSILGIYGLIDAVATRWCNPNRMLVGILGSLGALSLLLSPVFIRWADTGMVDVPIGLTFLVAVASVVMAVATRERRWLWYAIATFAFFVGTKGSFIAFVPAALVAAWVAARVTGLSARRSLFACAIMLVLCTPWYVKNFIQAGDPVPPYLNLALGRPDSKWTKADMAGVMSDVRVNEQPLFLLALPLDIIENPLSHEYREAGVTTILLYLFLPGIVLVYGFLKRGNAVYTPWFTLSVFLFYAIAYWLTTTHLGRYALLFYPLFSAFVAVVALRIASISRDLALVASVLLVAAALPAEAGADWITTQWQTNYATIGTWYVDPQAFLVARIPAYTDEERMSDELSQENLADPRVYVVGDDELDFYFKRRGVTKVGDWFGPERYGDFGSAIDNGTAVDFLARFSIDAVIVTPGHPLLPPPRAARLDAELLRAGYRKEQLPKDTSLMYFAPVAGRAR